MDDFSRRPGCALVVGGNGGLGRAVVRLMAERGSHVAVTFREHEGDAARVGAEASSFGVRASAHELDVTDAEAGSRVVAEVVERHGGLHTLVYAAGPHVPMVHLSRVESGEMAGQLVADAG